MRLASLATMSSYRQNQQCVSKRQPHNTRLMGNQLSTNDREAALFSVKGKYDGISDSLSSTAAFKENLFLIIS